MKKLFLYISLFLSVFSYSQGLSELNQLKKGQQRNEKALDLSDDFTTRVTTDSGTSESTQAQFEPIAYDVDVASLVITPSGFKAGKLYSVEPTDGTGDGTSTRASNKTRVNSSDVIETLANDVPSIDYSDGQAVILTEPQSTNLYLNSATLSTQGVTTTATPYTVSFYGTGTITFSGTHTGSLVGTGVNDRVLTTFTPSAGTLTSTVSGTVSNAQIENLGYATSWITTLGSTVTRLADQLTSFGDVNAFNSVEGVLYVEMSALANIAIFRELSLSDGTTNNRLELRYKNTLNNEIQVIYRNGGVTSYNFSYALGDITQFFKIAVKWKQDDFAFYVDGVEVSSQLSGDIVTPDVWDEFRFDNTVGVSPFYGKIKSIQVYKTVLTDDELERLTTKGYLN